MKYYEVTYDGLWLGGSAVVIAESTEDALRLVEDDYRTINFKNATVTEISGPVLYNDSGDY